MDNHEPENLDTLSLDELREYAPNRSNQIQLRLYAHSRRQAVECRLSGDINGALRHEHNMDELYKRLPAELRW